MGATRTPAWVVEIRTDGRGGYTPAPWNVRSQPNRPGYGRPTDANLAAYVARFEASTRPGGVNAHLGAETVRRAWVRRNGAWGTGETVARYEAAPRPMFEIVGGTL
jgi:hypothetical protein